MGFSREEDNHIDTDTCGKKEGKIDGEKGKERERETRKRVCV